MAGFPPRHGGLGGSNVQLKGGGDGYGGLGVVQFLKKVFDNSEDMGSMGKHGGAR